MNESLKRTVSLMQDWLSKTPPNLRAVGMLAVVSVLAIAVIWPRNSSRPSEEYLFSGRSFSKAELWVVETALAAAQLQDYSIEDGRVRVPAAQRAVYVQAITDHNALPPGLYDPTENALKETNLIEPGSLRDLRFSHADEKKAALAVKAVAGIEDAFVHYDETQQRGLRAQQDITALVGVLSRDGEPLKAEVVQTIHDIVLAWRAGLRAENVTVVDLRVGRAIRGNPQDTSSSGSSYAFSKRMQEDWTSHIKTVLKFIPQAQVAVSVLLPLQPPADVPSNATPASKTAPASSAQLPPRVAISVQVPTSYLRQVWQNRYTSKRPSAEDIAGIELETCEKIRSAIAPLLRGTGTNNLVTSPVSVTTFDDLRGSSDRASTTEIPTWLAEHWRIPFVIAAVLVAAALMLLARRVTPTRSDEATQRPFQVVRDDPHQASPAPAGAPQEPLADTALRDQLETLVERDPAAAAQTLADWIDKAG